MRRKGGNALVKNEVKILGVALLLQRGQAAEFHGYEVLKELEAIDGKKDLLDNSTLYRALRRLEEKCLVESRWETVEDAASEGREGRPRRYYRLTGAGASEAAAVLARMAAAPDGKWAAGMLDRLRTA